MTPAELLSYHAPGDGWTVQSGEAPHRIYRCRRSAMIRGRLCIAQWLILESDLKYGIGEGTAIRFAEETVRHLLEKERAKQP